MKKLILILFVLALFPFVSATVWSNTTFNDSLTSDNITFFSTQSFTKYLSIPDDVAYLTKANINLTGLDNLYSRVNISITQLAQMVTESVSIRGIVTNGTDFGAVSNNIGSGSHDITLWHFNNSMDFINNMTFTGTIGSPAKQSFAFVGNKLIWGGDDSGTTFRIYDTNGTLINSFSGTTHQMAGSMTWDGGELVYVRDNQFTGVVRIINVTANGILSQGNCGGVKDWFVLNSSEFNNHIVYKDGFLYASDSSNENYFEAFNTSGIYCDGSNWIANQTQDNFTLTGIGDQDSLSTFGNESLYNVDRANSLISNTLYETYITSGPYVSSIDINGNISFQRSSEFNQSNNKTSFINAINKYLPTCVTVGGFCLVPFDFNSNGGIFNYFDMSFNNEGFTENNQSFNASTISVASETFIINITLDTGRYTTISATLIYNNTNYIGTVSGSGTEKIISAVVSIPQVSAQTNKSFHWAIDLSDTSGTNQFNSTSNNQTINPFGVDNCSVFTDLILNFTVKDEGLLTQLGGSAFNTSVQLDMDITSLADPTNVLNFSNNYDKVNPAQVCFDSAILGNGTWRLDVQTRYTASDYEVEFFNIQNATLSASNFPQNIDLYPLLTVDSQEFLINFKDSSFLPSANTLLTITRKYISEGVFRTVEAPLTDTSGNALAHLVLGDQIYTIQVSKNGELLAVFDNVVPFCSDLSTGQCEINLNSFSSGVDVGDFAENGNITYLMTFNEATRTVSVIFNVVGGSTATVSLNTTIYNTLGNTTACSDQLTTSAGTLTCLVPVSFGNTTIKSDLYKDGEFIASGIYNFGNDLATSGGPTAFLLIFFLYITIGLMFIPSPIATVFGAILGVILAIALNMFSGGSLIGVSSTIIWFIIAGGILIWRINAKES